MLSGSNLALRSSCWGRWSWLLSLPLFGLWLIILCLGLFAVHPGVSAIGWLCFMTVALPKHLQLTLVISTSLISNNRLSRITAYLVVKIWSLFKHENLTIGNKILWKRGEIAPKEQFLLFSTYFQYISYKCTSGVKLYTHL